MGYSVGGLIQSSDFNNIINTNTPSVNDVWGTGFSSTGYGQPDVPSVAPGSIVTTNPWTAAINAITTAALHQGTSITPLTVPTSGDLIAFYTALQGDLLTVSNNRFNLETAGTDITASATRTTKWGKTEGIPELQSVVTITFETADKARYFFNCGGTVRLSYSRTGGTGTVPDIDWTQLCADVGTIGIPGNEEPATVAGTSYQGLTQFGGGGEIPDPYQRIGFFQLTPTFSDIVYRKTVNGTSAYTNDALSIYMNANGPVFTITTKFTDPNPAANAPIDGNLTVNVVVRPPATTYVTNSWGTPVINVTAPA